MYINKMRLAIASWKNKTDNRYYQFMIKTNISLMDIKVNLFFPKSKATKQKRICFIHHNVHDELTRNVKVKLFSSKIKLCNDIAHTHMFMKAAHK